jgi:hypothetical protein
LLLATMAVAVAGPVSAEEDMFDGKWHFALTPTCGCRRSMER